MVASLLKVLTTGIQDTRLQPTSGERLQSASGERLQPFQKVWIRAGRFTTRWERLEFDSVPAFGQTAQFRLLRKGHLMTRLYLVATMPDIYSVQRRARVANGGPDAYPRFGWTNSLGHALVQQLTMDIGNARVETMDSQLLEMLDEFYTPLEKVPLVNALIKRADNGFTEKSFGWPPANVGGALSTQPYQETVVVPLPFWFCRGDSGAALPIDAMGADEVRCGVTFRGLNGLYYTGTHVVGNTSLDDGTSLWPILGSSFYAADPVAVSGQTALSDANGVIKMPAALPLGDCYVMAEYVYLDQNEANRFRLADLQVPMVQHFAAAPQDTQGLLNARVPLFFPNPTREILFSCSPATAASYNAHFLVTRDLTGTANTLPSNAAGTPWWPDAVGLATAGPVMSTYMRPAFALSDSEPLAAYALEYQGSLVRYRTEGGGLFRSVLPSYELRKSPWHGRYLYVLPFGIQNGFTPISQTQSEANMDKIVKKELVLEFRPRYGAVSLSVGRFIVRVYSEAYNMLRVYGSRAGLMF